MILKLETKHKDTLGVVRCIPGLQAAEEGEHIWLKGIDPAAAIDIRLKQLPATNTFIIDEHNHLFLTGGVTPVDKLKQLTWQPLDTFIKAEAPVAALPGKIGEQVSIKLVASSQERKGQALLTMLNVWKAYAEIAAAARLQAVEFAVSEKEEVLILGYPLPSLPGKEYWMDNNILLPCGYEFEIPVASVFISQRLNENNNSVLLFDTGGNWQQIDKNFFVTGKRSAVRLTKIKDA